jgi:transcriptional regulator with XRE-family HTH domain
MPARPRSLLAAETLALVELGERLRKARLRRALTASAVAAAAGITRVTLHRVECGDPAVTLGTVSKVMGVLGLAGDIAWLARDDRLGRELQDARLPKRRAARPASPESGVAQSRAEQSRTPRRSAPQPRGAAAPPARRIRLDRYAQLRQLAWQLAPGVIDLAPEDAFALYERNWRHVDHTAMDANERALLDKLTATVGKGVLLV